MTYDIRHNYYALMMVLTESITVDKALYKLGVIKHVTSPPAQKYDDSFIEYVKQERGAPKFRTWADLAGELRIISGDALRMVVRQYDTKNGIEEKRKPRNTEEWVRSVEEQRKRHKKWDEIGTEMGLTGHGVRMAVNRYYERRRAINA